MSKTIDVSQNKTLKLTNVLTTKVNIEENEDFNKIVLQMENYVKSKGAMPIGPLIQKTSYQIDEQGQLNLNIYLMRQADKFIHNIEDPYNMESVLRVRDCIYAHYVGPEEKLKIAYDKINVLAFEEEIELSNENYTIFVNQQDDELVADIFVEKKSDE